MNAKQERVDTGELSPQSWADYKTACDIVVEHFGRSRMVADLAASDFAALRNKLAKRYGPHRLGKTIQIVRMILKFALDSELIDKPIRPGPGFSRPSKKTLRLHRAKQGLKLFSREEIHKLLDAASTSMRAMVLLGINAALGNSDIGNLPRSAVNLETGWIDFPRPKTGIPRRAKLWPETISAIRETLTNRPEPKDPADAELVFITQRGGSWAKDTSDNPISKETAKLLQALHINGRKGLGFYTLRHVFRTVADETKDQPAIDFVMGHADESMASLYRERISDERLEAVAAHVRAWLFGSEQPLADCVE